MLFEISPEHHINNSDGVTACLCDRVTHRTNIWKSKVRLQTQQMAIRFRYVEAKVFREMERCHFSHEREYTKGVDRCRDQTIFEVLKSGRRNQRGDLGHRFMFSPIPKNWHRRRDALMSFLCYLVGGCPIAKTQRNEVKILSNDRFAKAGTVHDPRCFSKELLFTDKLRRLICLPGNLLGVAEVQYFKFRSSVEGGSVH